MVKKINRIKKEGYRELNRIGTPNRAVEVDDSVFLSESKLFNGAYMQPNFKNQPYVPQDHEYTQRLNLFTGRNLKPLLDRPEKKENPPLFAPFKETYLPNRNDIMEKTLAENYRWRDETSTKSRQFEKPAPEIRVAPGVDLGYNAEPTDRPFHPWFRAPELTIDELRGEVRPTFRLNRNNIGVKGDKGHKIVRYEKRRPEAISGQGIQSRIIPGIGAFSSDNDRRVAEQVTKAIKRVQPNSYVGQVNMEDVHINSKPKVTHAGKVIKRVQPNDYVGNPYTGEAIGVDKDNFTGYDPKTNKKISYKNNTSVQARKVNYNSNNRGEMIGHDLTNREIALDACRAGMIDNDRQNHQQTNFDSILNKTGKRVSYVGNNDHDGMISSRTNADRYRNDDTIINTPSKESEYIENYRSNKPVRVNGTNQNNARMYRHLPETRQQNYVADVQNLGPTDVRQNQYYGNVKRLDPRLLHNVEAQAKYNGVRTGINRAQGAYDFNNVRAPMTAKATYMPNTGYMSRGSNANRGIRNTNINGATFNNRRSVVVNRPSIGVQQKTYANWNNQRMGYSKTNSNRYAADAGPKPFPRYPTITHYGYSNQLILGENTKNQKFYDPALNDRSYNLIKPIMKYR